MSLAFEHLGNYQEAVSNRKQGAFLAPPGRNPPELSGKVGVLAMRRSPRRFTHRPPQPHVSLACLAAHPFPRTLVIARTQRCPTGYVGRGGECSMFPVRPPCCTRSSVQRRAIPSTTGSLPLALTAAAAHRQG